MKREQGHAFLVGGDREQVVARIADLYIERRDVLRATAPSAASASARPRTMMRPKSARRSGGG